jgi:hypothetical protein
MYDGTSPLFQTNHGTVLDARDLIELRFQILWEYILTA